MLKDDKSYKKRKFRVKSYPTQWTALRLRGSGSSRRIF